MSTINPTASAAQAAQIYAAEIAEEQDTAQETSGGNSSHSVEQSADSVELSDEARALAEASNATPDDDAVDGFLQFQTPGMGFGSGTRLNNPYGVPNSIYAPSYEVYFRGDTLQRETQEAPTEEYTQKLRILKEYEKSQEYLDFIDKWECDSVNAMKTKTTNKLICEYSGLSNVEKFDMLDRFLSNQVVLKDKELTGQERELFKGAAANEWLRENSPCFAQLRATAEATMKALEEKNNPLDTNERYYISLDHNFKFTVIGNNAEQAQLIQESINSSAQMRFDMLRAILINDGKPHERGSAEYERAFQLTSYYEYHTCQAYLRNTYGISLDDIEIEYFGDEENPQVRRGIGKTDAARKALEDNPKLATRLAGLKRLIEEKGIPTFPIFDSPQLLFTGGEFSLLG